MLPWWLSGKEPICQYRRHAFDPWSGKIPRAMWQPSPVPQQLSLCPGARDSQLLKSVLWSPCFSRREATTVRSPTVAGKSSPPLIATREGPRAAMKTQHRQKERNKIIKKRNKTDSYLFFIKSH